MKRLSRSETSSDNDFELSKSALKIIEYLKNEYYDKNIYSPLNVINSQDDDEERIAEERTHFPPSGHINTQVPDHTNERKTLENFYFQDKYQQRNDLPLFSNDTHNTLENGENFVDVDDLFIEGSTNTSENFTQKINFNYYYQKNDTRIPSTSLEVEENHSQGLNIQSLNSSVDLFSQCDLPQKPSFSKLFNNIPKKTDKAKQNRFINKIKKNTCLNLPENKITNYFPKVKNEVNKTVLSEQQDNFTNIIRNIKLSNESKNLENNCKKSFINKDDTISNIKCFDQKHEHKMNSNLGFELFSSPIPTIKKKRVRSNLKAKKKRVIQEFFYKTPKLSQIGTDSEVKVKSDVKIIYFNESVIEEFNNDEIIEIGFTICYKKGFSSLDKPTQGTNETFPPSGLMIRFEYESKISKYLFIEIDSLRKDLGRKFMGYVLNYRCRKLCYEAQAFILLMIDCLKLDDRRECYDWFILDPLLGAWLLDPDKTHISFAAITEALSISKQRCNENWMLNICNLMKEQSEAMEVMYSLLISNSLWDLYINSETKLIPIIAVMESWNIKVNKEKIVGIGKEINEKIKSLEYHAMELAGKKFQIRSSNDLRQILYEELKLDKALNIEVKGTASTGVKSTAEPILKRLANIHPFPKTILNYRHLHKFKSTYVDGLLNYVRNNQFISTSWEQFSAATGRITSSSPNLQAIPKQPLEGFNIRSTFISREDHSFLSVDFQHIELRVFAHLADENKLIEAFHCDQDVFETITKLRLKSEIFDSEERTRTKTLVYAHLYGAGIKKIADILDINESKASKLINQFDEIFPGLKKFRQKLLILCRKDKKLTTLGGRQRHFPNICSSDLRARTYSERQAINFVIQGSAADICKIAMVCTEQKLRQDQRNSKLLLQIHDELMWEVADEHLSEVKETVKNILETDCWPESMKFKVPLRVKVTVGKSWGEMS